MQAPPGRVPSDPRPDAGCLTRPGVRATIGPRNHRHGPHAAPERPLTPDFEKLNGLVPAIAQDVETGAVLMLAWMNREAYEETLRTGVACYFSRSRNRLWRKGEESGHVQDVVGVYLDCDADTVLLKVRQRGGAACHEGYASCFFRKIEDGQAVVVAERVFDPKAVYGKS